MARAQTLLLAFAFLALATAPARAQCDHALEAIDTFGDGWNGATLDITVNQNIVLDDYALVFLPNQTVIFTANDGDAISTRFTNGGFDQEIAYTIYGGGPNGCELLGGEDGSIGPIVGLTGLSGSCVGTGACPVPPPTPPINDDCASAIALVGTGLFDLEMANATTDGSPLGDFCNVGMFGDNQLHYDVWFCWTAPSTKTWRISTLGLVDFDSRLAIYDTCDNPVQADVVDCNDDEIIPILPPFEAGLSVPLIGGNDYKIRFGTFSLSTFGNDDGQFMIEAVAEDFTRSCNGDGGDQLGCVDCPCNNTAAEGTVGGCLNSAGTSAKLIPFGSSSGSFPSDDPCSLSMSLQSGTPNTFAILISGTGLTPLNPVNPCFGISNGLQTFAMDGLRCVAGQVERYGSRAIDEVGSTVNGWVGLNVTFEVGETRHFQVVYREIATAGCQTGQNSTQAVSVTLAP